MVCKDSLFQGRQNSSSAPGSLPTTLAELYADTRTRACVNIPVFARFLCFFFRRLISARARRGYNKVYTRVRDFIDRLLLQEAREHDDVWRERENRAAIIVCANKEARAREIHATRVVYYLSPACAAYARSLYIF